MLCCTSITILLWGLPRLNSRVQLCNAKMCAWDINLSMSLVQVGGAGLGFGAPGGGSVAPAMPTSAASIARAPAEQKTAAALEAGFVKGGLESTVEGTSQPSVPVPAAAAVPEPSSQATPPVQQVGRHTWSVASLGMGLSVPDEHLIRAYCACKSIPSSFCSLTCEKQLVMNNGSVAMRWCGSRLCRVPQVAHAGCRACLEAPA